MNQIPGNVKGASTAIHSLHSRAKAAKNISPVSSSRPPIGQVAAAVGFESQSAFAKNFRQFTGKTPRMFAKRGG